MGDEDIPDGTKFISGISFEKKWLIKNIGTCTWTSGYELVFNKGDRMEAPDETQLTKVEVSPGESIVISVSLKAPDEAGTYQGDFLFRSADGIVFGLGGEAEDPIWVKIEVSEPTPTGTLTLTSTSTPTATLTATDSPKADLSITEFIINPASPVNGTPVSVNITVYNHGNAQADPFTVKWLPGENFAEDRTCSWSIPSLNAKGGLVLTIGAVNPSADCADFTYTSAYDDLVSKVIADVNNTVDESDEGNNTTSKTIDVVNP